MAHLVIDRALNGDISNTWPRWEEMLGLGASSGFIGAPKTASRVAAATSAAATQPAPSAAPPAPAAAPKPAPQESKAAGTKNK
jgi:hypothetical protein